MKPITHHWDERSHVNYVLVSGLSDEEKIRLKTLFDESNMPISNVFPPLYPVKLKNGSYKEYEHLFRFYKRPDSEELVKKILYEQLRPNGAQPGPRAIPDQVESIKTTINQLSADNEEFKSHLRYLKEDHNDLLNLLNKSNAFEDSIRTLNSTVLDLVNRVDKLSSLVAQEVKERADSTDNLYQRLNEMDAEFEQRMVQVQSITSTSQSLKEDLIAPTIVITGQSPIHRPDIVNLAKEIMSERYDYFEQGKHLFVFCDKAFENKSRSHNAAKRIQGYADYVIAGPGAHSIKGKPITVGWKKFAPNLIDEFSDYKGPLSLTDLRKALDLIVKNHETWKKR